MFIDTSNVDPCTLMYDANCNQLDRKLGPYNSLELEPIWISFEMGLIGVLARCMSMVLMSSPLLG
jgi:hypothetical protein